MAKSEEPLSLTPREMEVLALAWQCFETEPKIDIKKLARLTGYTIGSAGVTIGKIKRKLKLHGSGPTPTSTPGKASMTNTLKSGKRAAGSIFDESPSKKKKTDPVNPWEDDDETDLKIKSEPDVDEGYGGYDGYEGYGAYAD